MLFSLIDTMFNFQSTSLIFTFAITICNDHKPSILFLLIIVTWDLNGVMEVALTSVSPTPLFPSYAKIPENHLFM